MPNGKDVDRVRDALGKVEAAIKQIDACRAMLGRHMAAFGPTATAGALKRAQRWLRKADKHRAKLIKSRDDCKAALAAAQ